MKALKKELGAEIDVRDHNNTLVVSHDPYTGGELFDEFTKELSERHLIINIKSEGIEKDVIEILEHNNVKNYFLLDCTFPAIVKLIEKGFDKIALRFSEYEGMDTLKMMQGKVQWVWIDCFTKRPFTARQYKLIKNLGYKTCLVSPDLLLRPEQIQVYIDELKSIKCVPDAVCVKKEYVVEWKRFYKNYLF